MIAPAQTLSELIEKIRTNTAIRSDFRVLEVPTQDMAHTLMPENAHMANMGRTNAAMDLHETLVPGAVARIDYRGRDSEVALSLDGLTVRSGPMPLVARAWLLAILEMYAAR